MAGELFELHVLPVEAHDGGSDRFIVYRPRAGAAFIGNRSMAAAAQAAACGRLTAAEPRGALEFLDRIGFLAPDPPVPTQPGPAFRPRSAVLLLTNRCSLRCVYCYASAGEAAPEVLDPMVGEAVIDRVSEVARLDGRPVFDLCLHGGGEPTQAWQVVRRCVEYAGSRPVGARVTMTTNGVWAGDRLDWIVRHLDSLTLSLDGAPATQDRQRPFVSGRGSAQVVLETAAELDRRGFTYAMRLTALEPFDRLADDVQYLCETTSCPVLHVEPAFTAGRGGRAAARLSHGQSFAAGFAQASRVARAAGRSLEFSGAGLAGERLRHCSAPYEALIVTPSARLVTCYEVTGPGHPLAEMSTIGRVVGSEVVIDEVRRRALLDRLAERRRSCAGCWCRWTCAGDCYVRAVAPGPGGHLRRGPGCELNRAVTRARLLDLIAEQGVWHRTAARPPDRR